MTTVIPTAAGLTLTGFAPVPTAVPFPFTFPYFTSAVTAPAPASLTLTGRVPVINTTTSTSPTLVRPAASSLVLTGRSPTVTAGAPILIRPAASPLVLTRYSPTVKINGPTNTGSPNLDRLMTVSQECEKWRKTLDSYRRQKPQITIWKNRQGIVGNQAPPGLEYVGRVHYDDTIRGSFPFKKNEAAQGVLELRTDHYIAKFIRDVVTTTEMKKNIIIRVDFYGGKKRWTGLLHHQAIKTDAEGLRYQEFSFIDDMQFLQFLLGPPNPVLPIPIFQFPRVFPLIGPAKWAISVMILINLIRVEGNLWTLPDDPFSIDQWLDIVQWDDWQVHIKCDPFLLDDSTLWVVLATRMNPLDTVIKDPLDDAQLTLKYRRVFTDEAETAEGVLFVDQVANGALVFELVDDSGYHSPLTGTFLEGTVVDGLIRSTAVYLGGFIEDAAQFITDDQSLYPDEYWGPGFLGTLAAAPWLVIRDNSWTRIETSELTWSPATAVSVVVGGDNPAADAIARLIIETAGNLLGYFLLGGFSSAGTIAADVIMPFLEGTILAWLQWKNNSRALALGWVHLWELFQTGADQNAWSLSAVAALRGGFLASRSETSHTMTLQGTRWILPGLHFDVGSRVGSTVREYYNFIFVNQVEEMTATWDHTTGGPLDFSIKIGQNKASMSLGERQARAFSFILQQLNNLGVHLIA